MIGYTEVMSAMSAEAQMLEHENRVTSLYGEYCLALRRAYELAHAEKFEEFKKCKREVDAAWAAYTAAYKRWGGAAVDIYHTRVHGLPFCEDGGRELGQVDIIK